MKGNLRIFAAFAVAALSTSPARGESFRLAKMFDLAPGDRFELSSELGGATLRGVDGRQASIVVTSDSEDLAQRYDFRFDHSGGRLKMTVERKDKSPLSWFRQFRGSRAEITIQVPRATPVDLHTSGGGIDVASLDATVKADSSGGGVKVADVRGDVVLSSSGGGVEARGVRGALRLDSSGGGVRVESVEGPVDADTSGGSLTLDTVAGDVTASSSGGGVRIGGAGGRVKAGSSGGPVEVAFASGNAKGGDIDSSGGGVSVAVDPRAALDVDAASSGGSVRCNLPVTIQGTVSKDSLHGKLNGGGALLRLRSSGGGITIDGR
jgi:DUF4097 and DUF4098 domain-containing protein YvlB